MSTGIHRRNTRDGPRYRIWSTSADAYCTRELTYASLIVWLRDESEREFAREVTRRIERVNETGSSFHEERRDMDGPWDVERCDGPGGCGGFHHDFDQREGPRHKTDGGWACEMSAAALADYLASCGRCGEPEFARWHGPPCDGGE